MLKPSIKELTRNMLSHESGIYYACRGEVLSPQRLFLLSATHGQEIACPIALAKLLEEEWRWSEVELVAVMQDPEGYKEEGYGFLDVDGNASCWPPLRGFHKNEEMYWFSVDENSAWGNTAIIPPRHKAMRKLMDELQPTFCLSLHETVRSEIWRDPFWVGAGLLSIETWPISSEEWGRAMNFVGSPLITPINWLLNTTWDWIRPIFGVKRRYHAGKALRGNPYYQLVTKITDHFGELGGRMTESKWLDYLEMTEQLVIGNGRLLHEPTHMMSDWLTVTDYCLGHYGAPGVTTETFQCPEIGLRGINQRAELQYKYMVATLDILNEIKDANTN